MSGAHKSAAQWLLYAPFAFFPVALAVAAQIAIFSGLFPPVVLPHIPPYVGLTIFADRDNTSTQTIRGNGTNENGSATGTSGTIYIKSGTLDLRGNGYTLASEIVVGNMTMEGNPTGVTVAYDLSKNVSLSHTETSETTTEAYSYDATGLDA